MGAVDEAIDSFSPPRSPDAPTTRPDPDIPPHAQHGIVASARLRALQNISGPGARATDLPASRRVATPDAPTIEAVVALLDDPALDATKSLKSMAAYDADGDAVVILVPGD